MKNIKQRIGAWLMALVMVVTMLPAMTLAVSAAEGTLEVSDPNIGLSWSFSSLLGGNGNWTASGDTITGTATGYKMIVNAAVSTTLQITNNYSVPLTLSFSYKLTGGGSVSSAISGTEGSYSKELAAGASVSIKLTSPKGATKNTLKITDIKLIGSGNITTTFLPGEVGSYTVNGVTITEEVSYAKGAAESNYTLAAKAPSGYSFYGWYNEVSGEYLSYNDTDSIMIISDSIIKPVYIAGNSAHYGVGDTRYTDFDEAIAAAQAGTNKTVVVLKDGVLSGSHTIPAGITLLVPFNAVNTAYGNDPYCTTGRTGDAVKWVKPTVYRTLTLAEDAHLTVNGNIEIGGQYSTANGTTGYYCAPSGPLGHIRMLAGSHIDLNSGSNIYAWGYVYGDGTLTAKNGASVHEIFQITDFRGGSKTTFLNSKDESYVFPDSQYYVQNIESATRYDHGSTEYVYAAAQMSGVCAEFSVKFIGADAMFQTTEGSYFIKQYIPSEDRLHLETYGDCALSNLSMSINAILETVKVDSNNYVLPINSNMDIIIKTGTATLKQNVMLLPGSSVTVDEGATLKLDYMEYTDSTRPNAMESNGYIVQLFDSTNWTQGYVTNKDTGEFELLTGLNPVHPAATFTNFNPAVVGGQLSPAGYSPSPNRKVRTNADMTDVTLDVNGTIIVDGYMYSTVTYKDMNAGDLSIVDGGANVISSKGTGKIQLNRGAGEELLSWMYDQLKDTYYYVPLASVQLTNGDGSMLDTTGAEAGSVYDYCAEHDCWYSVKCCQCDDGVNHEYGVVEFTKTCFLDGYSTYTCVYCGDRYIDDIVPASHSYDTTVKAPTCVDGGYTTYNCYECGYSYTGDVTAATGHSYKGVETLAPTCGADGVMTYTCSGCKDSYTEVISATGAHVYENDYDVDCDVCGSVRTVTLPIHSGGCSVSEDDKGVVGLAARFNIAVSGMAIAENKHTMADYSNATVNGYKLLSMGGMATNGVSTVDIPCVYLYDLESTSAAYAVRIINIPAHKQDVEITFTPYFVVEIDGEAVRIYGEPQTRSYSGFIN